jgi:IS5 family transposase
MSQISFADAEQAGKRKKTRREAFLGEMELVVPWKAMLKVIEPHYPVAGRGRRPYPLQAMLRVHLMQNWFALSDPAMEEALYEIASLRTFAGLGLEAIPDETTILNFRHLLKASSGRRHLQAGQRPPGQEGAAAEERFHRRRDDHLSAQFHQERERRARP